MTGALPAAANRSALASVTVLDLSSGVAGPYCTRLLAGLGAEVIKVEPPDGDFGRGMPPFLSDAPGPERSALFHHLNGGKKSVTLDLRSAYGRSTVRNLAMRSHILVESFCPGEMAHLGFDFASLNEANPSLVLTSITNFGQSGPYKNHRASELVRLALGGMLYTTGDPDREPLMLPGYQASYQAGLTAAVATLAALCCTEKTGAGQHVDVSIMESVVANLEATTVAYARDGSVRRRQGNRHGQTHPMTILPCQDGYVGVMIATDADWETFAAFSGLEELLDPRFASGPPRLIHAGEIDRILGPWLMERTREELFASAQEWRFPFAMVLSPQEVLDDPQHRHRGFFSTVDHPAIGEVTVVGAPFQMSQTPWRPARAPTLGEHHAEVSSALTSVAKAATTQRTPPSNPGSRGRVLEGIRVVDLTTMWAGPYCTRLLADLGADVVKIEPASRVDGTRANPGYFNWLNRNKRSLTLDLNGHIGKEVFRKLVAASDVVVENFSPRVMPNFGLDYPTLSAIRPKLIMLSMPAYGSTGPYRNYVAYGPGIEAMSGLAWATGYRDGPPMLSGAAYADPTAGLHGAVAVLAALRYRRLTGEGQRIDLSQREALSQVIGEMLVLAGSGGELPPRSGNHHPTMSPHGCYRCGSEDTWVAIAVAGDEEWVRLCRALDFDSLVDNPMFATWQARKANEAELDRMIETWTRQHTDREAMEILQGAGVAAGAVLNAACVSQNEHLAARGFFVQMADSEGKLSQYPGMPWKTSAASWIRRKAWRRV